MATRNIPKVSDRQAEEKAHETLQHILDSGDEEDVSKTQAVLDLILFHIESKGREA